MMPENDAVDPSSSGSPAPRRPVALDPVRRVGEPRRSRVRIASTLLALAALPVVGATGYLFLLTTRSRRPAARDWEASRSAGLAALRTRFHVIVPAHDEAQGIAKTVTNLLGVDYPRELFEVVVVADNCTDDTAARARAAGARVFERVDRERRGKGYALAHAFEATVAEGKADAVVVVDADTVVSPNLLRAFDARLRQGAKAVQADYAVQQPGGRLAHSADGHRLRDVPRRPFGRTREPRGLVRPAWQRHVLRDEPARRGAPRRILRRGGSGVRHPARRARLPRPLRGRGARLRGDGRVGEGVALAARAMGRGTDGDCEKARDPAPPAGPPREEPAPRRFSRSTCSSLPSRCSWRRR